MADEGLRIAIESLARAVDRRAFLRRALRVAMAGAIGTAVGSFDLARTYANNLNCKACDYPPFGPGGVSCSTLGYGCPAQGGCPSGCKVCTSSGSCSSECGYSDGNWWVFECGPNEMGAKQCYDCQCPSSSTGCNGLCGCRSACFCCNCTTPLELAHELMRLGKTSPN